jgi:hypothetical protein
VDPQENRKQFPGKTPGAFYKTPGAFYRSRMSVPESVKDLGFFFQVVGTVVVIDSMALYPL